MCHSLFTQLERVWSSPWHQRLQEVLHTDKDMIIQACIPCSSAANRNGSLQKKETNCRGLNFTGLPESPASHLNLIPKHCVETGPWTILYTYGSKMFKGSVSLLKMLKRYCMLLQSFDFTEKSGYIKLSWYIITISIYNIYCIHVCVCDSSVHTCMYIYIYIYIVYITYIYIHMCVYIYIYICEMYIYICHNTTWCSMVLFYSCLIHLGSALRLGEGKFYEALGLHSGEALGAAGRRGGLAKRRLSIGYLNGGF